MSARSRPRALCSSCHEYGYDDKVIGKPCDAVESRGKCDGNWLDRTRLSDWVSCRTCTGTGYVGSKRCTDCKHSGWIPYR